jgi:hypothetical protein
VPSSWPRWVETKKISTRSRVTAAEAVIVPVDDAVDFDVVVAIHLLLLLLLELQGVWGWQRRLRLNSRLRLLVLERGGLRPIFMQGVARLSQVPCGVRCSSVAGARVKQQRPWCTDQMAVRHIPVQAVLANVFVHMAGTDLSNDDLLSLFFTFTFTFSVLAIHSPTSTIPAIPTVHFSSFSPDTIHSRCSRDLSLTAEPAYVRSQAAASILCQRCKILLRQAPMSRVYAILSTMSLQYLLLCTLYCSALKLFKPAFFRAL